jgi:hypothetical protein
LSCFSHVFLTESVLKEWSSFHLGKAAQFSSNIFSLQGLGPRSGS